MLKIRKLPAMLWLAFAACTTLSPALADEPAETVVKNGKSYLPYRKYQALPGKAIGVLVSDAQPVLSTEGRSGPNNELCFSHDGCSYRWVYVPDVSGQPMIRNLQVPIGNGQKHLYGALNLASPPSVKPFGVRTLFTLVEVEVNQGDGSPVNDSFVATRFKVLDGNKQYPLKVADVIKRVRKHYADWCKSRSKEIDAAMMAAQKKALKKQKADGPRRKEDLMYVTWMTKENTLQIRFRTKLSDGHYRFVEGGAGRPRPLPLPPRPIKRKPPAGGAAVPAQPPRIAPGGAGAAFPPPPPRFRRKVGTTFGVEFGRMYVISKEGKIVRTERLSFASFQQTTNALPLGGPRPVDPVPLPPRPGLKRR